MIWCAVCGITKRGCVISRDIIGPFSDRLELDQAVDDARHAIMQQGLLATCVAFELCDGAPDLLI